MTTDNKLDRPTGQTAELHSKLHFGMPTIFVDSIDRTLAALVVITLMLLPLGSYEYLTGTVVMQIMILGLAALGLNLLTGCTGQVSLGTGGFMAVGGFVSYNLVLRFPEIPIILDFLISGFVAALVGLFFGLPSLRIKGYYLAITTLAAQFFLLWLFDHVKWFTNYDPAGVAAVPTTYLLGNLATQDNAFSFLSAINPVIAGSGSSAISKYWLTLTVVLMLTYLACNLRRSPIGRSWIAVRDKEVAAQIIGIRPSKAKLSAFFISSFYCGVAGALYVICYTGYAETESFDLTRSFNLLFMIVIGGMASMIGSYIGACIFVLIPPLLNMLANRSEFVHLSADSLANLELVMFGGVIILFLILEPRGVAQLWQSMKSSLRRQTHKKRKQCQVRTNT